ncbi:MAG: iron-containing alcohol dehydrogenase [Lachnospirales bacterium]
MYKNILSPQRINAVKTNFFGSGAITLLSPELEKKGYKRALIVTDMFLYESGVATKVGAELLKANIEYAIYYDVKPNPTTTIVEECFEAVKALDVDLIVAVGGGSPIDTAKAVSILATNGGVIQDYEGVNKSRNLGLPIVSVNTTSGTGSEVTAFYVVTDEKRHSKMVMVDTNAMVSIAINDTDFMVSMPKSLTTATGMDALTHGIECVLSKRATPITDKDAFWVIESVASFLPRAYRNGDDKEARTMMAYAQNVAGQAFSNAGLGMVHAMAHALGGKFNLPHGVCNSLLLPYVLKFYTEKYEYKDRLAKITDVIYRNIDNTEKKCCINFVRDLMSEMDMPKKIEDIAKLCDKDFLDLAELAIIDTCMEDNIVAPTVEEIVKVYKKAYYGFN